MSVDPAYLEPNDYVDCDHPAVKAFAREHAGHTVGKEAAVRLYY
ncbi:MAG TPA: transglutaminase, partial [Polyangiaceae bacterium]|nr:transglutaminase [Polyangiaceae bacterium]